DYTANLLVVPASHPTHTPPLFSLPTRPSSALAFLEGPVDRRDHALGRALLVDPLVLRDQQHVHRGLEREHRGFLHAVALADRARSEEHTSEVQSRVDVVFRLVFEIIQMTWWHF